jgi:hypothetical protein
LPEAVESEFRIFTREVTMGSFGVEFAKNGCSSIHPPGGKMKQVAFAPIKKSWIEQRVAMASPGMVCPTCYSTEFRLSRLRAEDRLQLLLLRYPVRCKGCKNRLYATRSFANHLRKQGQLAPKGRNRVSS